MCAIFNIHGQNFPVVLKIMPKHVPLQHRLFKLIFAVKFSAEICIEEGNRVDSRKEHVF